MKKWLKAIGWLILYTYIIWCTLMTTISLGKYIYTRYHKEIGIGTEAVYRVEVKRETI